jgi:DNA-binding HxlR family transcriptional regulator
MALSGAPSIQGTPVVVEYELTEYSNTLQNVMQAVK